MSGFPIYSFFTICVIFLSPLFLEAQSADTISDVEIDVEYRPRTEWRYGYRKLPADSDRAAFFTSHRARFNVGIKQRGFSLYASVQDIRVWGDENTRDGEGETQFFEIYVEPEINEYMSVRVGRQRISYDDERLFAENEWRQAGGKHEAVRVIYKKGAVNMDLFGAYNQSATRLFGTDYDISWDFYKVMVGHYFKWEVSEKLSVLALNFADGYQQPDNPLATHFKYTNGGRLTFKLPFSTLTFAGYYQHGKIETGEDLRAFYIAPEISLSRGQVYRIRGGVQIISGDRDSEDGISTAFLAQYGAFHRYNGRMDYTENTVRTNNHEGVFNPYIIQRFKLSSQFQIVWESHLLGTQTPVHLSKATIYGWENDFRFILKPNAYSTYELGYMFMRAADDLTYLKMGEGGNPNIIPQFIYLQVTWKPKVYSGSLKK